MKQITLIVPLFNESANVLPLHEALCRALDSQGDAEFQFLFVDDGSADSTFEKLAELASRDPRVNALQLSRNFGKEAALSAGISHVGPEADAVILMDGDLQHPPEVVPQLIAEWRNGFEIVSTRRKSTEAEPLLRSLSSRVFYRLFRRISDLEMVSGDTDFRLLDRVVVAEVRRFTERNRLVRGLIDWLGFRRAQVEFVAPRRLAGVPQYSYRKLVRLAIHSFTSFSLFPLKIAGILGITISIVFGALLSVMVVDKATWNQWNFSPIAFVAVTNAFMVGIILVCLGLIALYIGNIHSEVLNRPLFIARKRVGRSLRGSGPDAG